MRATAFLGIVAVTCAGCVLESGEAGGDEGQTGQAREAAMYFDTFKQPDDRRIGPSMGFLVAEGGSVSVTVEPKWIPEDPSSRCRVPAIQIALSKRAPNVEAIGQKSFATMGGSSTGTWTGLGAGTYALDIHMINDNPGRLLTAEITIQTTP